MRGFHGSARAVGWSRAALRFHKVQQSSARNVCKIQCVVRPPSEKPLLMGGTLSKTEVNGFQHTFIVLSPAQQLGPKCWLFCKSDHVAAGLTVPVE